MKHRSRCRPLAVAAALLSLVAVARAEPDAARLFATHCAQCHGEDRLGKLGPALLPENLGRLTGARAISVITDGRAATQMPGFASKLSQDEISALTAYISAPLASVPQWGREEIEASRVIHADAPPLDRPRFDADPLNLFVVVEAGDHHATILDGDRFEPLARFPRPRGRSRTPPSFMPTTARNAMVPTGSAGSGPRCCRKISAA